MYVVLFTNHTSGSIGDYFMPNNHMRYAGQLKQQTNDVYFNNEDTVFIIVSKSSQNRSWSFFGVGHVISQITERVKHPQNPSPPQWILRYSNHEVGEGVDIHALNNALLTITNVSKEDVMSVLDMKLNLVPCKRNYRNVGIVPTKNKQ